MFTKQLVILLFFTGIVLSERIVRSPIVTKTAKQYNEDLPADLLASTLTGAKTIATKVSGSSSSSSSQSSQSNFDIQTATSEFGQLSARPAIQRGGLLDGIFSANSVSAGGASANLLGQGSETTQGAYLNNVVSQAGSLSSSSSSAANSESNAASSASSSSLTYNSADANLAGSGSGSSGQSDTTAKLYNHADSSSSSDTVDINKQIDSAKSGWLQGLGAGQSSGSSNNFASFGASIGTEIHAAWGGTKEQESSGHGSFGLAGGAGSPGPGSSGHGSSGHGSSGHGSSGHGSSGHGSSGHGSSGHGSSGHGSSGYGSSGHGSSGSGSSGYGGSGQGSWDGSSEVDSSGYVSLGHETSLQAGWSSSHASSGQGTWSKEWESGENTGSSGGSHGSHGSSGGGGSSGGWGSSSNGIVSTKCLNCMCNSFKDCIKSTTSCSSGFCGLFKITKPFWIDAGKCTVDGEEPNHPHAYNNCAKNINCVIRSIQAYMLRFKQDCNDDGHIDCLDFATIFKFGGHGCRTNWLDASFRKKITTCTAPRSANPFDSSFDSAGGHDSTGHFDTRALVGSSSTGSNNNLAGSDSASWHYASDSSTNQESSGQQQSSGSGFLYVSSNHASGANGQNASSDSYSTFSHWSGTTGHTHDLVSYQCLNCMCASFKDCAKLKDSCHSGFCGLFKITKPYWIDGGKYTMLGEDLNSETAYENCTKDINCVMRSIQGYMKLYKQDCNNDGYVDCLDFAIIHKFGGYGCPTGKLEEPINSEIKICAAHRLLPNY